MTDRPGPRSAIRRLLDDVLATGGVRHVVTCMAGVLIAACFVVSFASGWVRVRDLQQAQEAVGHFVAKFAAAEGGDAMRRRDAERLEHVRQVLLAHPGVLSVRFVDGAGAPLAEPAVPIQARRSWRTVEYLASVYDADGCPPTSGSEITRPGCLSRRAGTVFVGMTLEPYYAQRNLTIVVATAYAAFVALLGVALVLVFTWKPLRALELTAAVSEERVHLAQTRMRLVTVVSHEFRTPLAVIQVALDAIRRYGDRLTAEQRQARLNAIADAVAQLRDLLDEVLAVDRAEGQGLACTLVPTDVGRLCREVLEGFDVPAGHPVEVSVHGAGAVLVDPDLVRQILRNLLSNAVKYSPPSGRITVAIERDGHELVVRVVDQGIGIPARDLPHLFEPFQRAGNTEHLGGAGLGLASARRAAEAHGGSLTVRSIVGKGSTFEARLPYRMGAEVAPAA